ncbi:cation-translocating P-type ATPase [Streptomyces sp. NPDC030920]|uniref:cation-translocating P-type ATPase n=1 Tax=Streptomyces sp. NPDC030920 TaxID=3365308 RepID=UPI003850CE68
MSSASPRSLTVPAVLSASSKPRNRHGKSARRRARMAPAPARCAEHRMETGLGKGTGLPSVVPALPTEVGTSCGEGKPLCQQYFLTCCRHGPRSGRHGGALVAQRTGPHIATPSWLRRSRARAGSGSRTGGLRRAVVRMSREPVRWGAASLREGGPTADGAVPRTSRCGTSQVPPLRPSERTAESLQAMVPHTCRVSRSGDPRYLPARELVPGDVVLLEAGDAVSADCRLVEAHEVAVNNTALTGGSDAVARVAGPVPTGPPLEARNLVLMGTDVIAGTGKAVVCSTGTATGFGRIFRLTAAAPRQKTSLQQQVAAMVRRVAGVALATGAILFAVRAPSGQPFVDTFVFSLGVMVALVPEGLPATLSLSLAIGVRRMARRHALVKQLLAVEALGSTSVLCTGKTGTLTQAEMTVVQLWVNGVPHSVTEVGYTPVGEVTDAGPVRELLRTAALCSNARLVPPTGRDGWRVLGDTTEGALVVAAMKAGLDPAAEAARTPRGAEHPFDSVRKLMSTVHHDLDGSCLAYVKGAPLELLARCDAVDQEGAREPLTDVCRAEITAAADGMAGQGLRVLAVARRRVDGPHPPLGDAESGLTFLGLAGMYGPPRPEVRDAVDACRRAGIRIVMVTGDHPLTAEAAARRGGIVRGRALSVVTGTQLGTRWTTAAWTQRWQAPPSCCCAGSAPSTKCGWSPRSSGAARSSPTPGTAQTTRLPSSTRTSASPWAPPARTPPARQR